MSAQEAAFFYNDFSELLKEFHELDCAEKVEDTTPREEILT